jgi:hypothetical protein
MINIPQLMILSRIAETAVTIASPVPGLDGVQESTSKLARKRTKKEIVKSSSDPPLSAPESPGSSNEVPTVPPVKSRRPKQVEQTVDTKGRPEDTESKYCRPKKRFGSATAVVPIANVLKGQNLCYMMKIVKRTLNCLKVPTFPAPKSRPQGMQWKHYRSLEIHKL